MTEQLTPRHQAALEAKFGSLMTWTVPDVKPTIGPFDIAPFELLKTRRDDFVAQCVNWLQQRTDAEIDLCLDKDASDPNGLRKAWRSLLDDEISYLRRKSIPWYAVGFGHPEHVAEFGHWCRIPSFAVEELLCLSIGIEPKEFTRDELDRLGAKDLETLWPTLKFLLRRYELLKRQFGLSDFGSRASPRAFLKWADKTAFDVHPEFLRLLRINHDPDHDSDANAEGRRADIRELRTIARLLTLMAMAHFRYDPSVPRSTVPKKIAEFAAEKGIALNETTIRKYLKMGNPSGGTDDQRE